MINYIETHNPDLLINLSLNLILNRVLNPAKNFSDNITKEKNYIYICIKISTKSN